MTSPDVLPAHFAVAVQAFDEGMARARSTHTSTEPPPLDPRQQSEGIVAFMDAMLEVVEAFGGELLEIRSQAMDQIALLDELDADRGS